MFTKAGLLTTCATGPCSARFQLGLLVFVLGLLGLFGASAVALWRVARQRSATDDLARRILRNSAGPLAIQLVLRAMDMAFAKVLYSMLPGAQIGEYDLAALLVSLVLATVADWGLTVWLTREVARNPAAVRELFGTTLLVRWALALVMVPVAALVVGAYAGLQATHLISYALSARGTLLIAILTVSLFPTAFAAAATAVFLANEQATTPALANLVNNSLSTLLRIGVLLLGWGVIGVAGGALVATVINAAVFAGLLVARFGWPGWSWDAALARTMLRSAFALMLNSLLIAVFFRFDVFIIKANANDLAVANYNAAYKYAQLALVLPPIVINAVFPLFARQALQDRGALLRGYRLTLRYVLLLALPLAATLTVFAPLAIALLSAPSYVAAGAPALRLLIWFVPFSYINGVAQYVLIALGRQGTITGAFVATALFNLVANLVAVPIWGINAAAAVTVLSEIVLYLPLAVILQRELGAAPLWDVLWRPSVAALAAGGAMWISRSWPAPALVVGVGVYGAALWLAGTVTAEDRLLWQRLRRRAA